MGSTPSEAGASGRSRLAARALAALVGLALGLALAEGLARWVEAPVVATRMFFDASNDAYRLHRPAPGGLGYELVPGVRYGDVAINALGLRGEETTRQPRPGVTRVLVLGDSITLGAGMPLAETYPEVLEAALAPSVGPVEVLNAGVIGYNASQQALWFERHGRALAPDLVVVGACMNDLGGIEVQVLEGERWRVDVLMPEVVPLGLADGPRARALTRASAFARVLQRGAASLRGGPGGFARLDPLEDDNLDAYRRIRDGARSAGAALAIVAFPVLEAPPPDEWRAVAERLGSRAADLDVPFLDLAGAFAEHPVAELRIHPDDPWHPNPRGHRLAGEAIARFVMAEGLVDREAVGRPR